MNGKSNQKRTVENAFYALWSRGDLASLNLLANEMDQSRKALRAFVLFRCEKIKRA
jgi:hypothetical protein